MKLMELDMHCGKCKVIDFCGEPYSNVCLCANEVLGNIEEEDYLKTALSIRKNSKRNWSNKSIEKRIMKLCGIKNC